MARVGLLRSERSDDEARIGLAFCPFRLGDDPPLARPAVARRPWELLEAGADFPLASAALLAAASSLSIIAASRALRAKPNR
jgi:hypothetical protein